MIFHIYSGETYKLTNTPRVKIETITHRPPGQIIKKEKFIQKASYTASYDYKVQKIALNKKSIKKVLGSKVYDMAKKSKNKLKTAEDLIALLKLLE